MRKHTRKQLHLAETEEQYTTTQEASAETHLAHGLEYARETASSARHPHLGSIIDSTSDAMVVIDHELRVLDLNPAACKTLDCSPAEAVQRKCSELLRCKNLNHMELCGTSSCPLMRVLQKREALPNEELVIGTEPNVYEVSTSVTPVHIDKSPFVVFTVRDLTVLKVANRVRSNFVSMVSHELRTPLNSVHGFIDLLLQGHMGELTDEQRTYLGYAQEGVMQLVSIVEDILLMTRSDLGQFEIKSEEVQLRVLARQVMSSLHPQALK
ncbi:MAG: PAS domain S-box protein, partial [Ktedonobacteraceae bacterium]|nr:PAS domain S-box protein [Ktedonobacteraceae bacterium]